MAEKPSYTTKEGVVVTSAEGCAEHAIQNIDVTKCTAVFGDRVKEDIQSDTGNPPSRGSGVTIPEEEVAPGASELALMPG